MATIEAIRRIKAEIPGVHDPRRVQRELRPVPRSPPRAQQRVPPRVRQGRLDSAIVHASKILPLSKIPEEQRDVAAST
jgi:5-methyltetrahydrofolate--homocysteine methyltransferase